MLSKGSLYLKFKSYPITALSVSKYLIGSSLDKKTILTGSLVIMIFFDLRLRVPVPKSAALRTIFDVIPISGPFSSPVEREFANRTRF